MDQLRHQLSVRASVRRAAAAVLLLVSGGCGGASPGEAAARGGAVDSVLPIAEELRRFSAGLAAPAGLAGGAESIDALARRFVAAVSAGDTADLRRMHLDRAEFAHLYYPSAPVSRPPYELPPGILWFQVEGISTRGISRLLRELDGAGLRFVGVDCPADPEPQGENRVHAGCLVEYVDAGGTPRKEKLFGHVLERGGRFKFLSYANGHG